MSTPLKPDSKNGKVIDADIYKNAVNKDSDESMPPAIPAATVVLLRDSDNGVEVLMLRKNPEIGFGGMWVFPGGRIDPEDYPESGDAKQAARTAAAREASEEAGVQIDSELFIQFSQWTPPPITQKRFETSFFAVQAPYGLDINIDGEEIHEHQWINPAEAIRLRDKGKIDLVAPTWVTLHHISKHPTVESALAHLASGSIGVYQTHADKSGAADRVVMWAGDAGYETWDAGVEGPRHRLTMTKNRYIFDGSFDAASSE